MTHDEIVELLQLAGTYDRRTIGKTDISAWGDAARRGRWTVQGAQDAVREHYARSAAFLMPGHVTELVKHRQSAPAAYEEQRRALPPGPRDPEQIRTGVDKVFAALASVRAIREGLDPEEAAENAEGEVGARRLIRSVTCPHCRAGVDRPCVRRGKKQDQEVEMTGYHPSRVELATGAGEAA